MVLTHHRPDEVLTAEPIPGGFVVTAADNEKHWWSVAYRGVTPVIVAHNFETVDPNGHLGRHILAATRKTLA